MSSGIIDTSVLIDCLRGRVGAVAFLKSEAALGMPITHIIVAAELLAGARDQREQGIIDAFLTRFRLLAPDDSDAVAALDLFRKYHLSRGEDWPDCQIAATALRLGIEVRTQNMKHFAAFPGLRVSRAY
jgi:predicted nucleic acid-binding protein